MDYIAPFGDAIQVQCHWSPFHPPAQYSSRFKESWNMYSWKAECKVTMLAQESIRFSRINICCHLKHLPFKTTFSVGLSGKGVFKSSFFTATEYNFSIRCFPVLSKPPTYLAFLLLCICFCKTQTASCLPVLSWLAAPNTYDV